MKLLRAVALAAVSATVPAGAAEVPDAIAARGATVVLQAHAEGAQVYECKADASNKLIWQFREPIATLIVDGKTSGRHYAGPTWEIGGSKIVGKVAAKAPGSTEMDIPWLRLDVAEHEGDGPLKEGHDGSADQHCWRQCARRLRKSRKSSLGAVLSGLRVPEKVSAGINPVPRDVHLARFPARHDPFSPAKPHLPAGAPLPLTHVGERSRLLSVQGCAPTFGACRVPGIWAGTIRGGVGARLLCSSVEGTAPNQPESHHRPR